jgi:transposase
MKRFIEGADRTQITLLPECLDDFVAEDNPIRVVDVFVEQLDLKALGFTGADPAETGRPAYHPAVLLKLYIYGYLNRVQSTRRLEREAQRNVEVMWLTGRLAPDFKTIADFRRNNGKAIRRVCREFVDLCRKLDLYTQSMIAIDGSKFKADNNRDRNFTSAKLEARMQQIEASIDRYLSQMDSADRAQPEIAEAKTTRLNEKIARLKEQMAALKAMEKQVKDAPDGQVSLTDPDARSMATSGRGTGIVGYNVQTAVDTKHHLIVAHEVTNVGHDRWALASMAGQAKVATGIEKMEVVADRGYFDSPDLLACDRAGITTYVPKPQTSGSKFGGLYGKPDFRYDAKKDEYVCPAAQRLGYRTTVLQDGLYMHTYVTTKCGTCPLQSKCTPLPYRRIRRWEHEDVIDAMLMRLEKAPNMMGVRRQTVEHPFGTLKMWMGARHFLTRRMEHVSTEMSLHVLAYNLKRVMQILGVGGMIEAMGA